MTLALYRAILVTILLTSCFAFGQGVHSPEVTLKIESLPKDLEVHLALSAAPHLRTGTTVYVLDSSKGYVIERQATNGFTCYVQRTDYTREEFHQRPHCPRMPRPG